jgi:3D (Asp-Asp-Asp) domain-containing protein
MLLKKFKNKGKNRIFSAKFRFFLSSAALSALFIGLLFQVYPLSASRIRENPQLADKSTLPLIIFQHNSLSSFSNPVNPPPEVEREIPVIITAYSSTPSQTDDTPFLTAAGTLVREGIVANNYLAFGTEIRIPEIYGDRIFVVEDRMSDRKGYYHVDVWLPDYDQALAFGAKRTHIEILKR